MRRQIAGWSIALLAVLSSGAQAIEKPGGATADSLKLSESGVGHMLVVPYYSVQNNNVLLLSLLNTDSANGKVVKVRFRTARNADLVYDLQVFLGPRDMWTANVAQGADGRPRLTSDDESCTKPALSDVNATPFHTSRINPKLSAEEQANELREGYLEIIALADIPVSNVNSAAPLIRPFVCEDTASNQSWSALDNDMPTVENYQALGLAAPTTGLSANWSIFNVPKALSWSGMATAFEARKGDSPAKGNLVYFPQTNAMVTNPTAYSADPLFVGAPAPVMALMYDMPDLSTPYFQGADTPSVQASMLEAALSVKYVVNEYWADPSIGAATDWLISMPTRRLAVAIDYSKSGAEPAPVFNAAVGRYFNGASVQLTSQSLCSLVNPTVAQQRDREGAFFGGTTIGTPAPVPLFCGAASIISTSKNKSPPSSVMSANIAVKLFDALQFENGSIKIWTVRNASQGGAPVIGHAFVSANNPRVAPGTSGNFSLTWPHRLVKD